MGARRSIDCLGLAVALMAGLSAPSFGGASADSYRRLITVADSVTVNDRDPLIPNLWRRTVVLAGGVRQGNPDVSWTTKVFAYEPAIEIAATPAPNVAAFIDEHSAGAAAPVLTPGSPSELSLDGFAGEIGWFHSSDPSPNVKYSLQIVNALNISVGGRVVWMIDRGLRVRYLTTVRRSAGATDACLVIVAGRNLRDPDDPSAGVWFFGGLQSTEVPIILVSDGRIYLEQFNSFDIGTQVPHLAVFARDAFFTGPRPPSTMALGHGPEVMNELIDYLVARGALPVAPPPVPALDRWGAIVMVGLMALAGAFILRAAGRIG
jgi:hypothetical protein